jgi:hypothetical protein
MTGILMMSVGNSYGSLPINTVAPAVTGTAIVGQTLTTTNGTWTGSPAPTFTYQWQRITTNISGATSSTYVLQPADAGNTIRCVVTATNPLGAVSANSNSTASIGLAIGQAYGGGFYAGQISTSGDGVATHNLVIGPLASAQSQLQCKTTNTATSGTNSFIDGPANSAAMNDVTHPAAQFCEGLNIGGFTDWYMPARNELAVCYVNLKPTTQNNVTSTGVNNNSVPQRGSNYTAGDPAQTTATAFQSGGSEAFASSSYWSSTQDAGTNGQWELAFTTGDVSPNAKSESVRVRAVRRVAI